MLLLFVVANPPTATNYLNYTATATQKLEQITTIIKQEHRNRPNNKVTHSKQHCISEKPPIQTVAPQTQLTRDMMNVPLYTQTWMGRAYSRKTHPSTGTVKPLEGRERSQIVLERLARSTSLNYCFYCSIWGLNNATTCRSGPMSHLSWMSPPLLFWTRAACWWSM